MKISQAIYLQILFFLLGLFITFSFAQNINTGLIKNHLEYLASDSCQGRATGSAGEQRAAEYLKKQLSSYNIKPIGDNNSYFQQIPMHGSKPLKTTELKMYSDSSVHSLVLNKDYLTYKTGASAFLPTPLPMIFVGYGIIAPEYDYNDYQDVDVEGKIVVFLSGEPLSDEPEYFDGQVETIYSNPDSKQRLAISRGASGSVLLLLPEVYKNKNWDFWVRQFQFEDISLAYSVSANLSILLNPKIAEKLFDNESYRFADIYKMHKDNRMISFEMSSKLSIKSYYKERDFIAKNVVGFLEGKDSQFRDSYVLLSAHYDHLGIGPAISGDSIYNGAFDNAAGVSVLLEIARNLSQSKIKLKRSIIFLFTTGEEKGLLGSTYYTDHPKKPLYKTIVNINIDGISSFDETYDFVVFGLEYSDVGATVDTILESNLLKRYKSADIHLLETESINRSDQLAFAKAGIPFVVMLEGINYRNFSQQVGMQQSINWQNNIYHSPFDDLNQNINYDAVKQHSELLLQLCIAFANNKNTPQWKKDSPFLLRRLQTIAERR